MGALADEFARLMAQGVRICADADDRYHDPSRIDTSAGLYRQAAALGNKKAALNLRFSNFTGLYTTATALDARTERRVHALSIPLDKRKSRRRFIAVISGGLAELAQAELLQVEGVASVELLFDVNPLAGERAIGEFYGALVVTVFDDVEEATIGCIIHHPCVVVTMVAVAASSGRPYSCRVIYPELKHVNRWWKAQGFSVNCMLTAWMNRVRTGHSVRSSCVVEVGKADSTWNGN